MSGVYPPRVLGGRLSGGGWGDRRGKEDPCLGPGFLVVRLKFRYPPLRTLTGRIESDFVRKVSLQVWEREESPFFFFFFFGRKVRRRSRWGSM